MNTFDYTEGIDLTDDNADLFQSVLATRGHTAKFPKPLRNMPADDSLSVLETLRSIQKENPQIETIFLDSDEDEEDLNRKPLVSNVETFPASENLILHENNRPECDPLKLPVPPLCYINPNPKLIVKEVSPSDITLQNCNAIALKSVIKNSSAARYLVIPPDVLPILLASKGPVSLNIPGIGPLVIQKPSEILYAPKATLQLPEHANSVILPETKEQKTSEQTEYDPLCDAKYQCWRYRRRIKRDLDGFSLLDRLGFYKTEQRRSKLCAVKCEEKVKQLQYQIHVVKRKLNAVQESRLKPEQVGQTKKSLNRDLLKSGSKITSQIKSEVLNPIQKKNLDALISWQEHFQPSTEESAPKSDDDLLITKKVVVLNDSKTRRGRKRKIKHTCFSAEDENLSIIDGKTQNMETVNTALTSQKSARLTNKLAQKCIKKKPGRPRKPKNLKKKNKFHKWKEDITPIQTVKGKRERPKWVKVKEASSLYDDEISQMKSCHVQLSPVEIKPEVLERYETYIHKSEDLSDEFNHKVIENLTWLQNEIDSDKPILVVNEMQCSTMNLADLCHSNNVIFPVSGSSDLSPNFLNFISSYNIKFVKPEILCQYLSGQRG